MTYYQEEVLKIKRQFFSRDHLFRQVAKSKQYIDHHYHGSIDLNQVAHEASASPYHFIRLFKSVYGRTPHQYLIEVRVENARRLLRSAMSVTEVCHAVGFTSLSSFTGLFKKMTGLSPTDFRKNTLI